MNDGTQIQPVPLGLNTGAYDAIFDLSLSIRAVGHIAEMAKAGKKILIVIYDNGVTIELRDKFLALGCATNLTKDGLEIGAPDPTI